MKTLSFNIARLPRIVFGCGTIGQLPEIAAGYGPRALLVTGARSFRASSFWGPLMTALEEQGIGWKHVVVEGEPSPEFVDETVRNHRGENVEVVVGIGGGSALDAAKAIAGLLRVGSSVLDYLEEVGPELSYGGPSVPFIAVPTTAGTGSEATKNAVLSRQCAGGFKKSFRHEMLVAEWAVIDPDLLAGCPRGHIAANGMDALTQLIESYVSPGSGPLTDALAKSGLEAIQGSLLKWYDDPEAAGSVLREGMAYASLLSGICLAQTGLGSVHGLASPLGAFFPIPHGVICGTLVGAAAEVNLEAMRERDGENPALMKYAEVAGVLTDKQFRDTETAGDALVELLQDWTAHLALPPLSGFGVGHGDMERIVAASRGSSMKTNPIVLTDGEIRRILEERLSAGLSGNFRILAETQIPL